jgi:hypothetical protein
MKPIIVLPTTTSKATVTSAERAGYLPIVTDTPDAVRVIVSQSKQLWTGDDVMLAAMDALADGSACTSTQAAFFTALNRRIKANLHPGLAAKSPDNTSR